MMTFMAVVLAALQATAAPIAGLHYLVGSWNCTYRAGTVRFAYRAAYDYDSSRRILREIASWTGGGDQEFIAYNAQRRGWTATVLDGDGNVTVMRATGSDPNHMAFRSVYPDAGIAVSLDRVSATEYTLHGIVHSAGKTINSVDTCLR